jgi:hypothetical protein
MIKALSVKKLRDELEYWIFINIGQDIVDLKSQRQEYAHLVDQAQREKVEDVPNRVLELLDLELKRPWWKRRTFWRLVGLRGIKWPL